MSESIKVLEAELNAKIALVDAKLLEITSTQQQQLPAGKTLMSMNYKPRVTKVGRKRKYHFDQMIRRKTLYVPGRGRIFMNSLKANDIQMALHGSGQVYTVDELKELGVSNSLLEDI